jgi:hypothetical protein
VSSAMAYLPRLRFRWGQKSNTLPLNAPREKLDRH